MEFHLSVKKIFPLILLVYIENPVQMFNLQVLKNATVHVIDLII